MLKSDIGRNWLVCDTKINYILLDEWVHEFEYLNHIMEPF